MSCEVGFLCVSVTPSNMRISHFEWSNFRLNSLPMHSELIGKKETTKFDGYMMNWIFWIHLSQLVTYLQF